MSKLMRRTEVLSEPSNTLLHLLANPFNTEIQSDAIIVSLVTSLGLTLLTVLVFCFVRPHNSNVYAPRLKQANSLISLPQLRPGLFSWVEPIIKIYEDDYVISVGLDATLFIRFTSMCRNIFIALTVVGCGIIIPVNVFSGKELYNAFDGVPAIAKITPQYIFGEAAWAYVICAYVFDSIIFYFLWSNYKVYVKLRKNFYERIEYQRSPQARTLMITDIPEIGENIDDIVCMANSSASLAIPVKGTIARDVKGLQKLVKEHDDTVRQLESFLFKHLRDLRRPSAPMSSCLFGYSDGIADRVRMHETFVHLKDKLKDLNIRINNVRESIDEQSPLPYGFISFDRIGDAHNVAQSASKKQFTRAKIQFAPQSSDLLWDNLSLSRNARQRKAFINSLWVMMLTFIWIVPNVFIAIFLSNLTNLGNVWPGFQKELLKNPHLWAIVQAIVAPAILSLVYFYLPSVIRRLSMRTGIFSKTARDQYVLRKLYTFFIFNNLIVFSLFSAAWAFFTAIVVANRDGKSASDALGEGRFLEKVFQALCNGSFFWVMWLLQRNLVAAIDLLQVWSLVWRFFVHKVMKATPRQAIDWTASSHFDYASYYNYFLFYATVAFCYSVLQPLILPVAALYFSIDTWMKKYLLLYVYSTKNESNGQVWKILYNRLLFALFLSNIVILLVVAAQGHNISMLIALAPSPLLTCVFKFYCIRRFDRMIYSHGQYRNAEIICQDGFAAEIGRMDDTAAYYRHPALTKPLLKPLIHSSWVEQIKVLMRNMHVRSRYSGREAVSSNHENSQKRLFLPDLQVNLELDFEILEVPNDQLLQNACASYPHSVNTNMPYDSLCLKDLATRPLNDSDAASMSHCCKSLKDRNTDTSHKANVGVAADRRYTNTFGTSVQIDHPNELSQQELLLPNSAPMGQIFSEVSTPRSIRESESEYF